MEYIGPEFTSLNITQNPLWRTTSHNVIIMIDASRFYCVKCIAENRIARFVHSHFVFSSLSDPQQVLSLKSTMVKIIVQTIAAITIRKHSITTVKNDF